MKKRWIYIALLLSLAMNAGIFGVLLTNWLSKPVHTRERRQLVKGGFCNGANPQMIQEARAKNIAKIEQSQSARRSFINSLMEDSFDETKTLKHLQKYLAARSDLETSLGESLISIRTNIKDPQALHTFKAHVKQRISHLDALTPRDTLAADSSFQNLNRPRAKIAERLRQRRAIWRKRMHDRQAEGE